MSWRDRYRVHPAADVFPMMSDEELAKLGENIKAHGLQEPVAMMYVGPQRQVGENSYYQPELLLDGRNRLAAMERAGIDLRSCTVKYQFVNTRRGPFDFDATAYVIAANIHRRHLTKQERADLILAAVKAGEIPRQLGEDMVEEVRGALAKGGRGNTNLVKAKACDLAAKAGISKRTIERSLARAEGRTPKPADPKPAARGIAIVRRQYLLLFAELDRESMGDELEKLTKPIAQMMDAREQEGGLRAGMVDSIRCRRDGDEEEKATE